MERKIALLAALLAAAVLRLWAVASYPGAVEADSLTYHRLALSLLERQRYEFLPGVPTALYPPGHPAFLAGVYLAFGSSVVCAYYGQALLGVLTVALVARLAYEALGVRCVLPAAFLTAVYPALLWLPRRLLSENLALPIALGALCVLSAAQRRREAALAALGGVLLGLGVLVRAASIFIAIVALVVFALKVTHGGSPRRWLPVVVALSCAATTAPWILRNRLSFGSGAFVSTLGGLTFYSSFWPPEMGGKPVWGNLAGPQDETVRQAQKLPNEVAASRFLELATLRRLAQDPQRFFELVPAKLVWLTVPLDWEIYPRPAGSEGVWNWGYLMLLPPAVLGLARLWRQRSPGLWLVGVLPVSVLLQAIVFYGSPRFRIMAEPALLLLAAVALAPKSEGGPPGAAARRERQLRAER